VVSSNTLKTGSLKEKRREERTALILQAAYDVITEKGYYEASMDEIAARVGIAKGTLYLHFKSKEDLIFMLIEQATIKFIALVDEIINQESSVQNKLEHILLESYNSIQSGRQFLLALRSIGLNKGLIKDKIEAQASMAGLVHRFTILFEAGKANGEFDATVPTAIMVSIFLGLMELYSNEQSELNQLSPKKLLESVSHLFFHGLLAKS
jgi:TetR/AcrR family fatty acid metabolism transcriptional regulator